MTNLYTYILAAIILFAAGFAVDRHYYNNYKTKVEIAAKVQEAQTKEKDKQNADNAKQAEQDLINATDGISRWYRDHPVQRVLHCVQDQLPGSSGSQVPSTTKTEQGTEQGSASEVSNSYISQFRDDETEMIAAQLDQLLKLLKKSGVVFEK